MKTPRLCLQSICNNTTHQNNNVDPSPRVVNILPTSPRKSGRAVWRTCLPTCWWQGGATAVPPCPRHGGADVCHDGDRARHWPAHGTRRGSLHSGEPAGHSAQAGCGQSPPLSQCLCEFLFIHLNVIFYT